MTRKNSYIIAGLLAVFLLCAALLSGMAATTGYCAVANAATDFSAVGKAAYLMDVATGTVMYARNETERLPIASMVKIMTATLTLEAVDRGEISLDDDVTVSDEAASMGGSQVFLQAGDVHKVDDLLKTVIVASANDSCVALAQHIAGSVSRFVARMNARAAELGMKDTSFKNCTGLPAPESYSCAKDVATMFAALIKHPHYFDHAAVWLEDYNHPDGRVTTITNTNKLIRFYNGCDGGKTGYTSEAKFCLSATAKRDNMRVIAVMIGADSAKNRNAAVSSMFDHAFQVYSNEVLLKEGSEIDNDVEVVGGKKNDIRLTVNKDVTAFINGAVDDNYEIRYELPERIKAPVKQGDAVGKAFLVKNGEVIGEYTVIAMEDIARRNLFDSIGDIGDNWNTHARKSH